MATRKLGELTSITITRMIKPIGIRLRCGFASAKSEPIEFDLAGYLALAIAKEIEGLLPVADRRKTPTVRAAKRGAGKPGAAKPPSATRGSR
jgi:hypothetical protein